MWINLDIPELLLRGHFYHHFCPRSNDFAFVLEMPMEFNLNARVNSLACTAKFHSNSYIYLKRSILRKSEEQTNLKKTKKFKIFFYLIL